MKIRYGECLQIVFQLVLKEKKMRFHNWFWMGLTFHGQKFDHDVTRTRNLSIWSRTRYHCATQSYEISFYYLNKYDF